MAIQRYPMHRSHRTPQPAGTPTTARSWYVMAAMGMGMAGIALFFLLLWL